MPDAPSLLAWIGNRHRVRRGQQGGSAGGLVALLSERDLTGSGIEVEFFGEPPGSWAARPRSPNRPEPR